MRFAFGFRALDVHKITSNLLLLYWAWWRRRRQQSGTLNETMLLMCRLEGDARHAGLGCGGDLAFINWFGVAGFIAAVAVMFVFLLYRVLLG